MKRFDSFVLMNTARHNQTAQIIAQAGQWATELQTVLARFDRHFTRSELRRRVGSYVRTLILPVERKNGWQMAEACGDKTPYAVQNLLGRAVWDADAVRDDLTRYVVEHLGEAEAVLVVDETGFLKKGDKSAGVARQYSGIAGRIENCQIGVFLTYASNRGRTFLDRRLYLPKVWTNDPERCRAAGVAEEQTEFATKPQIARRMIERAIKADVPFRWIVGDSVYGSESKMRSWLEKREISYVLGITGQYRVFWDGARQWAKEIVAALPDAAWETISGGAGSKGERVYQWTRIKLRDVGENRMRWLLARRSFKQSDEITLYAASAQADTTLVKLAQIAGTRWSIEECFETAKGELGLNHYEVRSFQGWQRHMTLAMLAHAYLTVLQANNNEASRMKKKNQRRQKKRRKS
jgi:SRSO17 transposase